MSFKGTRNMKVIRQSGHEYKEIPTIILKGLWLQELGFSIGDHVQVRCESGQLVITRGEEVQR